VVSTIKGCDSTIITILTVYPEVTAHILVYDDEHCNEITLFAQSLSGDKNYLWSNGSTDSVITINTADTGYYVTLTANNGLGCNSVADTFYYDFVSRYSSYTLMADKRIILGKNNTVSGGSAGVLAGSGKLVIRNQV